MFSRFWYFVLAAVVGIAMAAVALAHTALESRTDRDLVRQLERDRADVELSLRIEARQRLDSILPIAVNPDVRSALSAASSRRDRSSIDSAVRGALNRKLVELNGQLRDGHADLLFAVDGQGEIISQLGGTAPQAGAGLGAFPLVRRALRGFAGDDVWIYQTKVYRMVASPVIDGGHFVGAIVHGMEMGEPFAAMLGRSMPGVTVAFYRRQTVLAAHIGEPPTPGAGVARSSAPTRQDLAAGLSAALEDPGLEEDGRTAALDLGEVGQAVFSRVAGSAGEVGVGYIVARPREVLLSPVNALLEAPSDDVAGLPWALIAGVPVVLFLLGLLFFFLERDRPFKRLVTQVGEAQSGSRERIDLAAHRGRFRKLAEAINGAMDAAMAKGGGAGPARRPVDFGEILGDSKPDAAPSYFGFATPDEPAASSIPTGPAPAKPAPPKPAPPKPAPPKPAPPKPAPPKPAPAAPAPAAMQPPAPAPAPAPPPDAPLPEPPTVAAPAAPADLPSFADEDEDDGATMIAAVPEELLAASLDAVSPEDLEQREFRKVYDDFIETKRKCGEPTAGLTFEKFRGTLEKNRDAIISKHGAKRVSFSVYVKNGKAALKATPHKN